MYHRASLAKPVKPQTNLIFLSILSGRLDLTRFSILYVSLLCFFIFRQAISTKPHILDITTNDYKNKPVVVELTNPCYRLKRYF